MSYGHIGVPATKGVLRILGEATVNLSRPAATEHSPLLARQIDLFSLGAEIDGAQIYRLIVNASKPDAPPENTRRREISKLPSTAMGPPAP